MGSKKVDTRGSNIGRSLNDRPISTRIVSPNAKKPIELLTDAEVDALLGGA